MSRILVGVLAVAALLGPTTAAPAATTHDGPSVRLLWHDGFSGPAGVRPDAARWNVEDGSRETGDLEVYRDDPRTIGLTGTGQLRITAIRTSEGYASARINSLPRLFVPPPHGALLLSARVRAAPGVGVATSFWSWGREVNAWPDNGEIDIAENLGRQPDQVHTALQCPTCHDTAPPYGLGTIYQAPDHQPYSARYHTFSALWQRDPDAVTWYVDGRHVTTLTPADTGSAGWVFDQPMFLLLAVRVGGAFVGAPDPVTLPATALIDDVSIWQFGGPPEPATAPPATG